jgi:Spy/CpxP family protein refolding chaperone
MKKIMLSILLMFTVVYGQDELENPFLGNDNFPMGYSLVSHSMPNFMHIYMKGGGMHKLNLTQKQEEAIEEVFATRPPKVMRAAMEIKNLETRLALEVVDGGKSVDDVKELLDTIAQKRKEMAMLQIGCMRVFQKTLTKEQYKILRDMAIEEAEDL